MLKALTMVDVRISPVPFTTIDANVAIGHIIVDCVCKEFDVSCNPRTGYCKNGKRFVPVKLVDVGGLIPGSHLGKGLGNAFLDDIRQASVLIQTVDASGLTDAEGKPTTGYNPVEEIEFLENEINLWFASVIEKAIAKFRRKLTASKRTDLVQILTEQLSGLEVSKRHIEQALDKASIADVANFAKVLRKLSKPILIAANKIDLQQAQENFDKLKAKHENAIPTSAEAEIALKKAAEQRLIDYLPGNDFKVLDDSKLDEKQRKALQLIKEKVIGKYGSTGVQNCLDKAVFELLNYIAVYPVADANKLIDKDANVLPDVFLIPTGTTVKELAFKVHTEIGEKFICGIDARTKRKLAADHELKSNDVVEIRFAK